MKDITPLLAKGKKQIEAYGNGGFKVAGERLEGNIIILPDAVYDLPSSSVENTSDNDLKPVLENAGDIEVLLVGGGKATEFFPPEIEKKIRSEHITIEYMDTGAAARTYNVLLTEERKVAVVLIAV